jgi:hypothetical protein
MWLSCVNDLLPTYPFPSSLALVCSQMPRWFMKNIRNLCNNVLSYLTVHEMCNPHADPFQLEPSVYRKDWRFVKT